ncbi:MAG: Na+/H+ antiporter subunit E [Nitrospiria bacterium]
MRDHIFLNIILAVIWCLLQEKFDLTEFVLGGLYGYVIIYLHRTLLDDEKTKRRVHSLKEAITFTVKTIRYLVVFLIEVVKANIDVVKIVLSPKLNMTPGIIAYKMDVTTDAGITLLANSITLTPGTLSVDVSEDKKTLYIHALHIEDARELEASIRNSLEKYSKEISG